MRTWLIRDFSTTKQMREHKCMMMLAVFERGVFRRQGMRHHEPRDPHGDQRSRRARDGPPGQVRAERNFFAGQPPHAPLKKILTVKSDCPDCVGVKCTEAILSVRTGKREDGRCEHE